MGHPNWPAALRRLHPPRRPPPRPAFPGTWTARVEAGTIAQLTLAAAAALTAGLWLSYDATEWARR